MRGLGAGPAPPVRPSGFSLCWVLSSAAYSYVVGAVMCSSVDAVNGTSRYLARLAAHCYIDYMYGALKTREFRR